MRKITILAMTVMAALTLTESVASNGNGPNSGSGGNSANNGNAGTYKILHYHGNGTYSLMLVTGGALEGHASHGDLWYHTGMPIAP